MQETINQKKREIASFFIEKGLLLTEDLLEALSRDSNVEEIYSLISKNSSSDLVVLNNDLKEIFCKGDAKDIMCHEVEKSIVIAQKQGNASRYDSVIEALQQEMPQKPAPPSPAHEEKRVSIKSCYKEDVKKREIQDFVAYFNSRYSSIEKILRQRAEMQSILSIARVVSKKDKETISVIGLVSEKATTKNGNIILTIEDSTGTIKVLVNKTKKELFEQAKDIVYDEIIGIVGVNGDNVIFANSIIWPDLPQNSLKKCNDEVFALFLSDMHVGSKNFLAEEFEKFISWIRGESGSEAQRNIAKKVDYIFIIGDLVDGVGIYPGQEEELAIKDIYAQYEECARLLTRIPERIKIIICPGNHDSMRIAEPQPELYKDMARPMWGLKNAVMVTNPSMVTIHSTPEFSGFDVLMYHGYSFDYYVANVDSIRNGGGYDRADLIMKFLLQRRHLAPSHKSTLYIPDSKKDFLVIENVPDFFVTGHIHKTSVANYKGITMISGSCWQSKTAFQEKVGHNPEPCRVPIVNLKTRDIKILKFT